MGIITPESQAVPPKYRCRVCGKEVLAGRMVCEQKKCYLFYGGLTSFPHRGHLATDKPTKAVSIPPKGTQFDKVFLDLEITRSSWLDAEL